MADRIKAADVAALVKMVDAHTRVGGRGLLTKATLKNIAKITDTFCQQFTPSPPRAIYSAPPRFGEDAPFEDRQAAAYWMDKARLERRRANVLLKALESVAPEHRAVADAYLERASQFLKDDAPEEEAV